MVVTSQQKAQELLQVLQQWREDGAAQACPKCGAAGLVIKDLSARPHVEWYRFSCAGCGLNETVAVPQTSFGQSGIN